MARVALRLWLAAAAWPAAAQSDELRFDHLTINDELSQSTIFAIAQDARGFMWFATLDGLDRYDGQELVTYRHRPNAFDSLADNNITALYADRAGGLWVGTDGGGLNLLNTFDGSVQRLRHVAGNIRSLGSDRVTALAPAPGGGLWVGTHGDGLNKLPPNSTTFLRGSAQSASSCGDHVLSLLQSRSGRLWVGTAGRGLCRVDSGSGGAQPVTVPETAPVAADATVHALFEDREGALWIGTTAGVARFDPRTGATRRFRHAPGDPASLSHDRVYSILEDTRGRLWIGTQAGLDLLDRRSGRVTRHHKDPWRADSLGDDVVRALFEDRSGLLWVGTANAGLSKLNERKSRFRNVAVRPGAAASLSNAVVWAIQPMHDGGLWVGTERGLNRWDPRKQAFASYFHDPRDPRSLGGDIVRALALDRAGVLWVGTDGGGLSRLTHPEGRFTTYRRVPGDARSLCSDRILTLYTDRSGRLWVGTDGAGVCRMEPGRAAFEVPFGARGALSDDAVYSILEDHEGVFWFGTLAGLKRFEPRGGAWREYRHDPADPASLSNDGVGIVFEDRDGQLWVGTDRGLNRFERETGRFVRYTVASGMANDFVYGMLQDPEGRLWLSTNHGLARLDPATANFLNLDARDGLPSNEFNAGARAAGPDGRFYFGSVNGYTSFVPREIGVNDHAPPVVITELRVFDNVRPLRGDARVVELDHRENFVSFEFAALEFTAPGKNCYAYRLDGVDRDWVLSGTRRSASYANLAGGHYVFRVMAANNDGVWNLDETRLELRIHAPPWWSWWARGAYVLLAAGALFLGVRARTRAQARALTERIRRLTRALAQNLDLQDVLQRLLDSLTTLIRYEQATVFLELEGHLEPRLSRTAGGASLGEPPDPALAALARQVAAERQPIVVTGMARQTPSSRAAGARCALGIPLEGHQAVRGVVVLVGARGAAFARHDVDVAATIVSQASFAVENAWLFAQIKQSATVDGLTGVYNRRHFFQIAERALQAREHPQRPLSVIMLDVDLFKRVNDEYGHLAGDEVIRGVAVCCLACVRQDDIVARYGGEEFVILLADTDHELAMRVAERLRAAVEQAELLLAGRAALRVTVSLGVATARSDERTLGALVDRADAAMYAAKRAGRNRVVSAESAPADARDVPQPSDPAARATSAAYSSGVLTPRTQSRSPST